MLIPPSRSFWKTLDQFSTVIFVTHDSGRGQLSREALGDWVS